MLMDAFFPLFGSIAIGSIIAAVGYYFARKSGLTSVQTEYASTLAKTNEALIQRVAAVEERAKAAERRATDAENESRRLSAKMSRLERTVAHLAEENDYLRERMKMPARNSALIDELRAEAAFEDADAGL